MNGSIILQKRLLEGGRVDHRLSVCLARPMGIRTGIVGLPNVGKSTLFNALASGTAAAENFPFCTIDPNVGIVAMPDPRLALVHRVYGSRQAAPATLEFVDIAGLVRGASRGEGLGNKFLANIREVDAILHVVRCFEDENIAHTDPTIDPRRDVEIVETELGLRDLETVQKRKERAAKQTKAAGKEGAQAKSDLAVLEALEDHLNDGKPASTFRSTFVEGTELLVELHLLTQKPVLYIANVAETATPEQSAHIKTLEQLAQQRQSSVVAVSAAFESELGELGEEERREFLDAAGLSDPGLVRVIGATFSLLQLVTFFTANDNEARAWNVPVGTPAPKAAGVIHTDFERGFIRAEVIAYGDLEALGSESAARGAGKLRSEGRDYLVQEGDVILFRFNV